MGEVLLNTPSMTQLAQVIGQTIVPAFLLGALASFLSVLVSRLNRIVDRIILLNAIDSRDQANSKLREHIPILKRRAGIINRAIFWAIVSSITIAVMVIVAFASAFAHVAHERGVAILFIAALATLIVSLIEFARETRIAINDIDNVG
jgi:uncharacterized membrane protein YgcG